MIFRPLTVSGAYLVEPEQLTDERGFFARVWASDEFRGHGLHDEIVQASISFNSRRGTLRGMHWQASPHEEAKLVRCTAGAVYDVVADVRPDSTSFGVWEAVELSAANHLQLYVPPLVAHGFQTLEDDTEIFYAMSAHHAPDAARGFRWNDPAFAIEWPSTECQIVNERDLNWPDLAVASFR